MFPPLKVELLDLDPNASYILLMDMAPVDKYRYKYQNSTWVKCFEEECSPTRLYVHPDSPNLGCHWMNSVINFYKLKLTNNQLDKQGHVSSCCKYFLSYDKSTRGKSSGFPSITFFSHCVLDMIIIARCVYFCVQIE